MNLIGLVSNIHWLPVFIITLFSFVIGFVWHSKFLFGKFRKQENYPDDIPEKINAPLVFGGTAIVHFVAISGISAIVTGLGGMNGLIIGLIISLVWILPAMLGTYLFANRSLQLFAIDAGMYIVMFSISGFVLGIW